VKPNASGKRRIVDGSAIEVDALNVDADGDPKNWIHWLEEGRQSFSIFDNSEWPKRD
jgi:hypothetical protein